MPKGARMTIGGVLGVVALLVALWVFWPSGLKTWVKLPDGRSYAIDLPANPGNARLIVMLHGGGGRPGQIARNAGFSAPALAMGYAVAYPAGSGRLGLLTWNAGYCCGYAQRENIDDLTFLNTVASDARARFGLSPEPFYIAGMSNGAMMAETFAALYPDRVAAAAAVSGTLDLGRFAPTGPVPLLVIHGTADENVRYDGGYGKNSWAKAAFTSVEAVMQAFAAAYGNPLRATDSQSGPIRKRDWQAEGQTMLRRLAIDGGGHIWFGGVRAKRSGDRSGLSATAEILRFFADHP